MSARDVDLEFEKAYQRLFSRSTGSEGSSGADANAGTASAAESSKAPPRPASSSPAAASPGPSSRPANERQHTPREDASTQALLRHQPAHRTAPTPSRGIIPARLKSVPRERPAQPGSSFAGLDALARYSRTDNSKGKARAQSSHLNTHEDHVPRSSRSPLISDASLPQQQASTPIPQARAVTYYPYPHAQASYPASGAFVGPSLTSMPGQAVAWAQPVMSAGPMPAMAYPGFSAQVTFSQPQFFASHPPQQLQSALTTLPQQYTHQQSIPATPIIHASSPPQLVEQQQQQASTSPAKQQQEADPAKSAKMTKKRHKTTKNILEAKIRKILQASGLDFRTKGDTSPRRNKVTSSSSVVVDGSLSPSAQARHYARSVMGDFREKRRVKLNDKPKKKATKPTTKPLLDDYGNVIRRKRGRPRIRPLTPEVDVKPKVINGCIDGIPLVKTEAQDGVWPSKATSTYPPTFDGSLPMAKHAGKPFRLETYTLFIHQSRRLRWLVRQAISKVEVGSDTRTNSPPDTTQWARWSNSIAAQLQGLGDEPLPSSNAATASAGHSSPAALQAQSQSDPAGLFPRERRRGYVALRKQLHSAARTATARICIHRLIRYLAKVGTAADRIDSHVERRKYVERRCRAAKLHKHAFRFARPTTLNLRKMWIVWARTAHQSNPRKVGTMTAGQQRRASFAPQMQVQELGPPPPQQPGVRVKLEPESPTKTSLFTQPAHQANLVRVKAEPMSDEIMTPPLLTKSVTIKSESGIEPALPQTQDERTNPPLFLRRNFRLYRLLGLSNLPLS